MPGRVVGDEADGMRRLHPALARAVGRLSVVAVTALLVVGITTPPATAQASDEALLVEDARLHPSLTGVEITGAGRSDATVAYRGALGRRNDADAALTATRNELADAGMQREQATAEVATATAVRDAAQAESVKLRTSLRGLAVQSYMRGGASPSGSIDLEAVDAELRQQAMVNTVSTNKMLDLRTALDTVDRSNDTIDGGTATLEALAVRTEELTVRLGLDEAQLAAATAEANRARATLADWRLGSDVAGTDIPLVVLDAYVKAAERMGVERPECGLRWWGLAGIGRVESRHATFTGTRPGPDGVTLRQIIGIPLDGTNNTALVPDTDGGALDGDIFVDRAVGPMQFIPGTWRSLGRDATGDGRADPHNIYDAALSAAGLLCRAGGAGLDQPEPLRRAALAYNASGAYADLVVRTAFDYAARGDSIIPPPPPSPEEVLLAAIAAGTLPIEPPPPTPASPAP